MLQLYINIDTYTYIYFSWIWDTLAMADTSNTSHYQRNCYLTFYGSHLEWNLCLCHAVKNYGLYCLSKVKIQVHAETKKYEERLIMWISNTDCFIHVSGFSYNCDKTHVCALIQKLLSVCTYILSSPFLPSLPLNPQPSICSFIQCNKYFSSSFENGCNYSKVIM